MIKKISWTILICVFGLYQVAGQISNKIIIDKDIHLIHLKDSVFVHRTWEYLDNFGRFSSNGMIVIKNGQAIMVDTPMDNEKTQKIVEYLKNNLNVELQKLIIGHFHDDCLGGLGYIQSQGIESIANSMTIDKCKELGLFIPTTSFTDSLSLDFNGEQIICRFFGGGHTIDNITIWLPSKKILFGGCLIKSINSRGLGNLADAVVSDWDITIKNLMNTIRDIKIVIPGHGDFGGSELLSHTIELVEIEKKMQ